MTDPWTNPKETKAMAALLLLDVVLADDGDGDARLGALGGGVFW